MFLKPRRWYSSPEVNPLARPTPVRPQITAQLLRYSARVPRQHGPILRIRTGPRFVQPDESHQFKYIVRSA